MTKQVNAQPKRWRVGRLGRVDQLFSAAGALHHDQAGELLGAVVTACSVLRQGNASPLAGPRRRQLLYLEAAPDSGVPVHCIPCGPLSSPLK